MQPDSHSQDIKDLQESPFPRTAPESPLPGVEQQEPTPEREDLDLELTQINVQLAKVDLRTQQAGARQAGYEADQEKARARKLDAEASAAQFVADSIPAEKRQARVYGWLRIGCIAIAFALTVAFLILAFIGNPWGYLAAVASGGSLKPLLFVITRLEPNQDMTHSDGPSDHD